MKKIIVLVATLVGFAYMSIGVNAFAGCKEDCKKLCEDKFPDSPSHQLACRNGCQFACENPAV